MDEYSSSLIENKKGTTDKTVNDSDTKQFRMNLSPIKNSPEDSPLRRALEQPPLKRFKVGRTQDAGTITEPDSLGPCEPGTAINLDGIVWNETKGGLLSLNITWRGKSFMGTLMDCSTTEHGSEWASPWVGDNEAPDQKPKVSRNKQKKSKKKRKKRKNIEEANLNHDVSLENIDLDENDEGEESVIEPEIPVELVECNSDNCGKKFASESALKYHVSFAHEKIIQKKEQIVSSDCISKAPLIEKVEPETDIEKPKEANEEMEVESNKLNSTKQYGVDKEMGNFETAMKKVEIEKPKSKPFPSMQNIRPIVPVQQPQIAGSSLKPIQPKPTILPAPAVNLCLDSLKRLTKRSPSQKLEKSPKSITMDILPKGIPKYQNVNNYEEEPMVIDLSTNKDIPNVGPKSPVRQETNSLQKFSATNLYSSIPQNAKPIPRDTGYNTPQEKNTQKQESVLLKIPNPSQKSPKDRSPSIFVKTEFNTGHRQNLSDQTDQPEIIKHTKSGTNVPIPPKSIMPSIFANPMGYLPHSYFSSHSTVPGLMMPPLNTNPLMLPGLMNIPPTAAPSSPFGSSLESLARAAEERARNFGSYSPAHIPAAFSPAHVPAAFTPSLIPTSSANPPRAGPPPASDSSDAPLLRHEHMHTHLHYITSPTHSQ